MIDGTNLEKAGDTAHRLVAVTLPPKRRSKPVCDDTAPEPVSLPIAPTLSRRPRMKRSGLTSLQWRTSSNEQPANTVRISPQILSPFRKAIGATGKSSAKKQAHDAV